MTKDELIAKELNRYMLEPKHIYHGTDAIPAAIHKAMDEYAKQQAIAFDIWKIKNGWLWDNSRCKYFKWEGDDTHETCLSHEEIYSRFIDNQFIEQQNKP